jgi:hypothetical protein
MTQASQPGVGITFNAHSPAAFRTGSESYTSMPAGAYSTASIVAKVEMHGGLSS